MVVSLRCVERAVCLGQSNCLPGLDKLWKFRALHLLEDPCTYPSGNFADTQLIGIGSGSTVPYVVDRIVQQGAKANEGRVFLPTGE